MSDLLSKTGRKSNIKTTRTNVARSQLQLMMIWKTAFSDSVFGDFYNPCPDLKDGEMAIFVFHGYANSKTDGIKVTEIVETDEALVVCYDKIASGNSDENTFDCPYEIKTIPHSEKQIVFFDEATWRDLPMRFKDHLYTRNRHEQRVSKNSFKMK